MIRFVALLILVLVPAAAAQDRIGYANLDLIVAKMPEYRQVSDQLEAYQEELVKALETKRAYAQQKLVEARDAEAAGIVSDEKLGEYETELRRLDREIKDSARDSDEKLMDRRNELMAPVIEKLQGTVKQVAEAEGYTHVLNMLDGTGTSVLLWGVEERNLTEKILAALGIPAEETAAK
ncbi:MAG: OmpH family outer membrane protein [Candidatus Eiseniibacteriota bacterium]